MLEYRIITLRFNVLILINVVGKKRGLYKRLEMDRSLVFNVDDNFVKTENCSYISLEPSTIVCGDLRAR